MKRATSMMWVILVLLNISSCSREKDSLTLGMVPTHSPEKLESTFEGIRNYLQTELDREIVLSIPNDYRTLIRDMEGGKIDIALFGPFSYIIADNSQDLIPLVLRSRKDMGTSYNSLIITSINTDIRTIDDLQNKSFAFVDKASTSGFIIPYALFISRQINYETFFSSYEFYGSHDKVYDAVVSGKADAGVMSSSIMAGLLTKRGLSDSGCRIIWKSDPIPGSPFIARADLDQQTIDAFLKAMIGLANKDPEALNRYSPHIETFVPIEEDLYRGIRNIIRILGEEFIINNSLE